MGLEIRKIENLSQEEKERIDESKKRAIRLRKKYLSQFTEKEQEEIKAFWRGEKNENYDKK